MRTESELALQLASLDGLKLDWSYQNLSIAELEQFASKRLPSNFAELREQLMNGEFENKTEGRKVAHVLSRGRDSVVKDLKNSKFANLVRKVRSGNWLGATGKPITDIVNVGVGGSDLGPLMTSFALAEFASDVQQHEVRTHFVSSMDGGQLYAVLPVVNPETTLFIVASKSFGTIDTFANIDTVIEWIQPAFNKAGKQTQDWLNAHVVGLSASPQAMTDYGIPAAHQLTFSQAVGGRFSMWSSIGFAIATTCGVRVFERLLAGAKAMDEHFLHAQMQDNIPLIMALTGVYNREIRGINNLAILPYDGRFRHLPSYLQQLDMESNGKQCDHDGKTIDYPTGPIIWGGFGPNGQHAFFQHLHQGYDAFSADFVLVKRREAAKFTESVQDALAAQQDLSVANCLAHRRLMAFGYQGDSPRDCYPGGHPSNLLAIDELTPETFGALIAAYEHKVFTQGVIWQLNSFDQPGVERGKKIAVDVLKRMRGESDTQFDASTEAVLAKG
ncbi:glucose-6-phosphate isomerase [Aliidiomarina maris]|uniref:Glucose-6-phosphate isomerase n=1 Tax=Aliidiomarina maris TaxID=531312 RepID=A0A327WR51_9GAMM|nr:glucose-6-phosphate isomerase [Aliidiomarina maris]RAJ94871.1 glucose-6-phosphate isomerase [Aliidiomarina maris]RUO20526.1 glucose-6-phosphate isomerase [Aliidiomarina maris]